MFTLWECIHGWIAGKGILSVLYSFIGGTVRSFFGLFLNPALKRKQGKGDFCTPGECKTTEFLVDLYTNGACNKFTFRLEGLMGDPNESYDGARMSLRAIKTNQIYKDAEEQLTSFNKTHYFEGLSPFISLKVLKTMENGGSTQLTSAIKETGSKYMISEINPNKYQEITTLGHLHLYTESVCLKYSVPLIFLTVRSDWYSGHEEVWYAAKTCNNKDEYLPCPDKEYPEYLVGILEGLQF